MKSLKQTTLLQFLRPAAALTAIADGKRPRAMDDLCRDDTPSASAARKEAAPTGAAPSPEPSASVPRKVQTTLDFGQSGSALERCARCGMVFSRSDEDISVHRRFCRRTGGEAGGPAKAQAPLALPDSSALIRRFPSKELPDVTLVVVERLAAVPEPHPAADLVRRICAAAPSIERAVAQVGSGACVVAALRLRKASIVVDACVELLGCVVGEPNQRLFVARGSTGPPVTLCDVHAIHLSRAGLRARARAVAGGGVVGMSDQDQDLFGALLAPTAEEFLTRRRDAIAPDAVLEAGARVLAALLGALSRAVVYGVKLDEQRQLSYNSVLVPAAVCCPRTHEHSGDPGVEGGDEGSAASFLSSSSSSSPRSSRESPSNAQQHSERPNDEGLAAVDAFTIECMRRLSTTVNWSRVHVHTHSTSSVLAVGLAEGA